MSYLKYGDSTPKLRVHRGINVASSTFTGIQRYIKKEACNEER